MKAQERARRERILRKVVERKAEIDPGIDGLTVKVGWNDTRRILTIIAVHRDEEVIPGMGGKTRPRIRNTELIIDVPMLAPKDNATRIVRKSREMLEHQARSA